MAAAAAARPAQCRTPPPPSPMALEPPGAPRFGFDDPWTAAAPRRQSARLSSRPHAVRTPSPSAAPATAAQPQRRGAAGHSGPSAAPSRLGRSRGNKAVALAQPLTPAAAPSSLAAFTPSPASSTRSHARRPGSRFAAASPACPSFVSPEMSPVKKGAPRADGDGFRKPARGPAAKAAAALAASAKALLPTPDKTPRRPSAKSITAVKAIARNLFPADADEQPLQAELAFLDSLSHDEADTGTDAVADAVPTRAIAVTKTRRVKKQAVMPRAGASILDSFDRDEAEAARHDFTIFTDSHDRVPKLSKPGADNPFHPTRNITPADKVLAQQTDTPAAPRFAVRRSARNMVHVSGEGFITIEEAVRREDGMLCNFRGKKIFRKFNDEDVDGAAADADDDANLASLPDQARLAGPLTRRSVKPRLLFPGARAKHSDDDQTTDVDDDMARPEGAKAARSDTSSPEPDDGAGSAKTARGARSVATPEAPASATSSLPETLREAHSAVFYDDGSPTSRKLRVSRRPSTDGRVEKRTASPTGGPARKKSRV